MEEVNWLENEETSQVGSKFFPYFKETLIVKDMGTVKHSLFEASHREYQIISLNMRTGEEDVKCTRSYKQIWAFYSKIKTNKPYLPISKLFDQELQIKLLGKSEEMYRKRQKQISFFINYVLNHEELSKSEDFNMFMSKDFRDEYFNTPKPFFENKESYNFVSTIKKSYSYLYKKYYDDGEGGGLSGAFSRLFGMIKDQVVTNSDIKDVLSKEHNQNAAERELRERRKCYEDTKLLLEEYLEDFKRLIINIEESSKIYEKQSDKLSSKTIKNPSTNKSVVVGTKHGLLLNDLSSINSKYKRIGNQILSEIEDAILLYDGVIDSYNLYYEFLDKLDIVLKAIGDSKLNPSFYNATNLDTENSEAQNKKDEFEAELSRYLDSFDKDNEHLAETILSSLPEFIKNKNTEELVHIQKK